ncbi:MAG: EamA family transporter [Pseudonocardiaceae bacterium]
MWARGPRQWIAVVLALSGTIWLTGPSGSLPLLGVGIGLVASALRGVYVVLNRRVGSAVPGWSGLSLSLSIGAVLVIPFTIAFEGPRLKTAYDVVGYGFMVAIFSSLVPYSLDFAALRRISVHTFSILLALSPVIGALAGLIMLGEHQTLSQWIAMIVVVTAGLLASGTRDTQPFASDFSGADVLSDSLTARSSEHHLIEPGPSPCAVREVLTHASRVADHGRLQPWRGHIFDGPGRTILACSCFANKDSAPSGRPGA